MSDNVENIIDKILDKKNNKKEFFDQNEKLKEDYSKALKGMAGSEFGNYFLKTLVNYIGLFEFKESQNHADMLMMRGKKQVYLELIRPYLTKTQRKEIEND